MKRYSLPVLLATALVVLCASASMAVFPTPDGFVSQEMHQGWHNGSLAWFIATDTNNCNFANQQSLTLAPKLSSAIGVVPVVWIVLNPPATQGPIFQKKPGEPEYAGIWEVHYITWNPSGLQKYDLGSCGGR